MFSSSSSTPEKRLEILLQRYQSSYKGDPALLRLAIPPTEVWRFFIDGVEQSEGFMPYEAREANYLLGVCKAFQRIHQFDKPVTTQFIRQLHLTALNRVADTQYDEIFDDDEYVDKIGYFRQSENGIFGVVDSNASVAGIVEMLNRDRPGLSFRIRIEGLDINRFGPSDLRLNKRSLTQIKQYVASREAAKESGARVVECPHPLTALFEADNKMALLKLFDEDSRYEVMLVSLARMDDEKMLAEFIYQSACSKNKVHFESLQLGQTNVILNQEMENMIAQYEQSMRVLINPMDKLRCIIQFIQSCEQLHPFLDGNCRVFCMLLLNHLLMKNGFPMTMLPDPNRFDLLSINELIENVIQGMETTLNLIESKKAYGIVTQEYLASLKPQERAYFDSVMAVEEQSRAKLSAPAPKR